jgi:hypothetical protein
LVLFCTKTSSPERRPGQFAVVGLGVEVDDHELFFQEADAGDEVLPLDAVLVQVVRVPVRGRPSLPVQHYTALIASME